MIPQAFRWRVAVVGGAAVFALGAPMLAQRDSAVPAKADLRTVAHVLNRIGFGPRPGDLERVQAMGLPKYIDDQLHPARVPNSALDERLSSFTTLGMSNSELMEKYFAPADELRQAQQRQQARTAPPPDPAMAAPRRRRRPRGRLRLKSGCFSSNSRT